MVGQQQSALVIAPTSGWVALRLDEVWRYRELVFALAWREISVRYKQTMLGCAWAVIQPLFAALLFSLFFGKLAKMPSDGVPYPIFSYTGMLAWQFFATAVTNSSTSLLNNSYLLTKVYCPRLVIPIAAVLPPAIDFAIAFFVLLGMMFFYGVLPTWKIIVFLPAFLLLALITALGVGLWLSALTLQYRDVRHVIPFMVQCWMYASPVVYSSTIVPRRWITIYGLNPLTTVIEGFRWAVLGVHQMSGLLAVASLLSAILILISGAYYFRRMEKTFADVA